MRNRGDVIHLLGKLKDRPAALGGSPHSYLPLQIFAEAGTASPLFQLYLLNASSVEPNIFITVIVGLADGEIALYNQVRLSPDFCAIAM